MRTIGRLLVTLLALIGTFTVAAVIATAFLLASFLPERRPLPDRIVLTSDWQDTLTEVRGPPDLFDLELRPPPTVSELVLALDRASRDPRVSGLVVRLAETNHGFAVAQELRDAVRRFTAAGKFAVVHADTFGELGAANEGYYIAAAFQEIHLAPAGLVGLTGLVAQVPLVKDLLARFGVGFEVVRRAEYKTALESLSESELSEPNREMLEALLDALDAQLVGGIAEGRGIPADRVRELIDRAPLTADEALAAKLVDRLDHGEDALDAALSKAGRGADTVDLADYAAQRRDGDEDAAANVTLIAAAGLIRRGEDGIGREIAADDLADLLLDAAEDRDVDAVLLRLDSGGGSAVASDTIAEAIRRVRVSKPLIVSMGNAAASGGYWISMGATWITAQPATLTGSIGVIAGKPDLAGTWDQLDVRWAELARGANAGMWSLNHPYTPEARARVDAIVGELYERFTEGVARGRDLPLARVQEIAKGRVWAGEAAQRLGLVDELGGLGTALAAVRRQLQLPQDAALAVELRPRSPSPLRALLRWVRPDATSLATLVGWLRALPTPGTAVGLPIMVR